MVFLYPTFAVLYVL